MADLPFAGIDKLTLLDYPGRVAAILFFSGCNMRCPFCHNAELASSPRAPDPSGLDAALEYLGKRRAMLDGVVVSGGEPTLLPLGPVLERIKSMGYAVKLDTNGLRPDVVREWLSAGLVDYVAMDLKNSPARYAETAGVGADPAAVERTAGVVRASGVAHEFRTTVSPSLHSPGDVADLCRYFGVRDDPYFIQPFAMRDTVPDRSLVEPDAAFLDACLRAALPLVPNAKVRTRD